MKYSLKFKTILFSLCVVALLTCLNLVLIIYNRNAMRENNLLKDQTEELTMRINGIFGSTLRGVDLGIRGYALTKDKQFLSPYYDEIERNEKNLFRIDSLFQVQHLDWATLEFAPIKAGIKNCIDAATEMKNLIEKNDSLNFKRRFDEDQGYYLWKIFKPFADRVLRYENVLVKKAIANYITAQNRNITYMAVLCFISLPTMIFVLVLLAREEKKTYIIVNRLNERIKEYLFDSGKEVTGGAFEVIESAVSNLKNASLFVKGISDENYETKWNGLTDAELVKHNKNNLAGNLLKMRDSMRQSKQKDMQRLWLTEGLTAVSELINANHESVSAMLNSVLSLFSKYLRDVGCGSIYLLNETNSGDTYLELSAGFGNKMVNEEKKRIEIGEGLIGQCFIDGNKLIVTKIPKGYISIQSGLGYSSPNFVFIIPFKFNHHVEAIVEIATFKSLEDHQIQFMEKAGEFVASAIYTKRLATVSSNSKIKVVQ